MTTSRSPARCAHALSALALSAFVLAGCATTGEYAAAPSPAPAAAAATRLPDLSGALRCMDQLLQDHGARDYTLVAEDLADPVRQGVASKDLLIAAVSEMGRRSRAVRITAQGAEAAAPNAPRAQYLLRGSVSRPDSRLIGVNLALMHTQDGSAVPGVTAHRLADAPPEPASLRTLVEGASIEIVGRLAKVPYWSCLGQRPDDPAVAAEMRDWYDGMAARPKEIIEFFQARLRHRGAYHGPIDGAVNADFNAAVTRYRGALGLSSAPKLSIDFLTAWMAADHRALATQVAAAPPAPAPSAPSPTETATGTAVATATAALSPRPPQAAPVPLAVRVNAADDATRFARDELIRLTVRPTRDAHVYCFLQDEHRAISRFFPNRFQRDSRVGAGTGLQLPGAMRFEIRMNGKGVPETVACFATERDVLPELPPAVAAGDFAALPVKTMDELRGTFERAARGAVAHSALDMQPR